MGFQVFTLPNALIDEQRSFKPPKPVQFRTGVPQQLASVGQWSDGLPLKEEISVRVGAGAPIFIGS